MRTPGEIEAEVVRLLEQARSDRSNYEGDLREERGDDFGLGRHHGEVDALEDVLAFIRQPG